MRQFIFYLNFAFVSVALLSALIFGEEAIAVYFYLAAFQLLSGFIILGINSLSLNNRLPEILIYWILVLAYFVLIGNVNFNEEVKFLVIPILIAMYHCYTTYKLTKL